MNPWYKLKAYENKKEKCIEVFAFQNRKIIDNSSWFLLIYFSKFRISIFKYYFRFL